MFDTVDVIPYSIENLDSIFLSKTRASAETIAAKAHRIYFKNYFEKLSAKTIVVECNYVDRDFLEDYSAYYVRCFDGYSSKCTRLHFFSEAFSKEEFVDVLRRVSDNRLKLRSINSVYLGFIVVKNLPNKFLGRTCLKTYPQENGRYYPIIRKYSANLFGIGLSVRSLAYQEQDSVVAACATSALWSTFHGTGILYQHRIPSPVEITKMATSKVSFDSRTFPNRGLLPEQMAYAIREINLEPLMISVTDEGVLKNNVYAYLKVGIPVILGIKLFNQQSMTELGNHAVAITGFHCDSNAQIMDPTTNAHLYARSIDKIYAHDDQVGPFARMHFETSNINYASQYGNQQATFVLTTSWQDQQQALGNVKAIPLFVIVPLYHKIRIPYDLILDVVVAFNNFIEMIRPSVPTLITHEFKYEVFLIQNSDFKIEMLRDKPFIGDDLAKILVRPMPKFLWRSKIHMNGQPVLDFLFDATDIETGNFFLMSIEYNKSIGGSLNILSKKISSPQVFGRARLIFDWYKNQ